MSRTPHPAGDDQHPRRHGALPATPPRNITLDGGATGRPPGRGHRRRYGHGQHPRQLERVAGPSGYNVYRTPRRATAGCRSGRAPTQRGHRHELHRHGPQRRDDLLLRGHDRRRRRAVVRLQRGHRDDPDIARPDADQRRRPRVDVLHRRELPRRHVRHRRQRYSRRTRRSRARTTRRSTRTSAGASSRTRSRSRTAPTTCASTSPSSTTARRRGRLRGQADLRRWTSSTHGRRTSRTSTSAPRPACAPRSSHRQRKVSVTNGTLSIESVYGSVDDPEITAIEVVPAARRPSRRRSPRWCPRAARRASRRRRGRPPRSRGRWTRRRSRPRASSSRPPERHARRGDRSYDGPTSTATLTPVGPAGVLDDLHRHRHHGGQGLGRHAARGRRLVDLHHERAAATPPARPSRSARPPTARRCSGTTTVTATATDNGGVAGVQFKLDGANLGAEDTTAPYSRHAGTRRPRPTAPTR